MSVQCVFHCTLPTHTGKRWPMQCSLMRRLWGSGRLALAVLSIADGGPRTPQPGYLSRGKVFQKETSRKIRTTVRYMKHLSQGILTRKNIPEEDKTSKSIISRLTHLAATIGDHWYIPFLSNYSRDGLGDIWCVEWPNHTKVPLSTGPFRKVEIGTLQWLVTITVIL